MTRKKFLLPDFDACSVALFASLVFMGPPAARVQTLPTRPPLVSTRLPDTARPGREPANRTDDDDVQPLRERSRG